MAAALPNGESNAVAEWKWANLHVHEQTAQMRCLMTTICNKDTPRGDWIFSADRVIRLMIEFSLNFLPIKPKRVVTAVEDAVLEGSEFAGKIVGVSVIRAGEAMETALRSCCRNVRIGKILIQRDEKTATPVFYMATFPSDIGQRHVLLLDPMLATGGSALCAIAKLIDAGVDETKIVFVTVVSTTEGISRVLDKYPRIHICTASVAEGLTARSYIKRSVGDFGDRYFTD